MNNELKPTSTRTPSAALEKQAGRKCIDCENEAQHERYHREGGWSPFWCLPCDEKRIARIDRGLKDIAARFGTSP